MKEKIPVAGSYAMLGAKPWAVMFKTSEGARGFFAETTKLRAVPTVADSGPVGAVRVRGRVVGGRLVARNMYVAVEV